MHPRLAAACKPAKLKAPNWLDGMAVIVGEKDDGCWAADVMALDGTSVNISEPKCISRRRSL